MSGVEGRADRHYPNRLGNLGSSSEHGGTTQPVSDEDLGGLVAMAQHVGCSDSLTGTEPGEVEAEDAEPLSDETARDLRGRGDLSNR